MERPDDDLAWASDDIPVPDPPNAPVWRRAEPEGPPSFESLTATAGPELDAVGTEPSSAGPSRTTLIAAAIAASLVVVVVVVGLTRGSGDEAAAPAASTSIDSTSPESTSPESSPVTISPINDEPPVSLGPVLIDLPPEVAAIAVPTEVLMQTSGGLLRTLSLPSGRVRSVVLTDASGPSDQYGGRGMVVAPDAAAFVVQEGLVIVPRDGPVTIVDPELIGGSGIEVLSWQLGSDGSPAFLVASYGPEPMPTLSWVTLDGTVTTTEPAAGVRVDSYFGLGPSNDGYAYINDAGGVYRIDADGAAQRIETGQLLAANLRYRLVRDCDETLACGIAVVDQQSGERRPVGPDVLASDFQATTFGYDLAPDGTAVTAIRSTATNQERVLVDLVTGSTVTAPSFSWGGSTRWAADSSGVFETSESQEGLDFIDRASGQAIHFADELGSIVGVGTRWPEAELAPSAAVVTSAISLIGSGPVPAGGLAVVATERSVGVVRVDLDGLVAESWGSLSTTGGSRPSVFATDDGIAVVVNSLGFVSRPGDETTLPDGLIGQDLTLAGPDSSTVWTSIDDANGVTGFRLVDLAAGSPVEPKQTIMVAASAEVLGSDGAGGIVVRQGGDLFVATAAGSQRLTSGELLALGARTAYVRECDDARVCAVVRIDRTTGKRSDVVASPFDGVGETTARDSMLGVTVSPGGQVVLIQVPLAAAAPDPVTTDSTEPTGNLSDEYVWAFVDLERGAVTPIGGLGDTMPVVWSSDGGAAAFLAVSDLWVYGRDASEAFRVEGLGALRSIGDGRTLTAVSASASD